MQVYIVSLGKYNEGEATGAWFELPADPDVVANKLGLDDTYEEVAIHDFETPFEVSEYMSLDELNHLAELALEMEGTGLERDMREIQQAFFSSFEEMVEQKDEIFCYPDCGDMEEVAMYLIEETGMLGEIPERLQNYIDYAAYGRDLEIEGSFLITSHGIYEYIG